MPGTLLVIEQGLRFVPLFPFDPGVTYFATFQLPGSASHQPLELGFSIAPDQETEPPRVTAVHPSAAQLPENLLRFHVTFAQAMRRGSVERAIVLLGPDGIPAEDALYRAPVEMWDRDMTQLTILLDPGRLKRGVGPNRELGPPVRAGSSYSLVLRPGMRASDGREIAPLVLRSFLATEAVRQRLVPSDWTISPPTARSRDPLAVRFPHPLDWALLHSGLDVFGPDGSRVSGRVLIEASELAWRFSPDEAWSRGRYELIVDPDLEDVCGNRVGAEFDRPIGCAWAADPSRAHLPIPFEAK